jgi:hypothetical protein
LEALDVSGDGRLAESLLTALRNENVGRAAAAA